MKSSSNTKSLTAVKKERTNKAIHGNSTSGRREARLASKDKNLVVGVDIGGSNLRIALADIRGEVLGRWKASTKETSSAEMVIVQIEQGVDALLAQCSSSRRALLSIAAGTPGVTDSEAGVVLATSFLRGWKDVPFRWLLESRFAVPAAIENDVRMAAIGEHWIGAARNVDDFVFLGLGTGIAAGIFANGKLIRGVNCTAGEVGYMHVPGSPEDPAKAGAPGSLESVLGGGGIQEQWAKNRADSHLRDLRATEIFARAARGDELAQKILDRSAQLLAYAIYNISLVLNSSLFVLGGGVGVSVPLRDATERVLAQYTEPSSPKLAISSLGKVAQIMGAIRLAMTTAEVRGKATV